MKNKIYLILSVCFLIISSILIYTNLNKRNENKQYAQELLTKHDSIQKVWKGKSLITSDSIYSLKSGKSLNSRINNDDTDLYIISYIDADCSNCVTELQNWEELVVSKGLKNITEKNLIFIARSDNKEMLKYQVYTQAGFDMEIYHDKEDNFVDINKIPNFKSYQAFVYKNNKVIYIGSPIKEDYFLKEINQLLNP